MALAYAQRSGDWLTIGRVVVTHLPPRIGRPMTTN